MQGEPVKLPELSLEKSTVPEGMVGLELVSVTVAEQVVAVFTSTEEKVQVRIVVVVWRDGATVRV